MASSKHSENPRKQLIYVLNLRTNSIRQTSVESIFYQKNLGVSEITPESMKNFCKKYHPAKYDEFCQYIEDHPDSLYIDFEDILQGTENNAGYSSLIESIRIGGLSSVEHKGFLACILIIHAMRSYEMFDGFL